jgi:hypothetical protein
LQHWIKYVVEIDVIGFLMYRNRVLHSTIGDV